MDEKFKQSLGMTSTASEIGFQKVCDVRDLPDFGGTLVSGTGKNFTQLPAVCLLIDILGFGTLMEHKNPVNVAFESDAFFKSCLNGFEPTGYSADQLAEQKKNIMRLSDTAALWHYTCPSMSDKTSRPELEQKALKYMIEAGKHLLVKGFQTKRWALRGTITLGICIQDSEDCAIIGRPWSEAATLEKNQQWAGIALHSSASSKLFDELKHSGNVLEYPVPLKKVREGTSNVHWVIDWRNSQVSTEDIDATFKTIPGEPDESSLIKILNTKAYLKSRLKTGG